jgi:hypothetical protein
MGNNGLLFPGSHGSRCRASRRARPAIKERAVPATVVVGTQWGDEGKGKFTDLVAKEMHLVVR